MKTKIFGRRIAAVDPTRNPPTMIIMDDAYPVRENYFQQRLNHNIRVVEQSMYSELKSMTEKHMNTTNVVFGTATKKDSLDWLITKFENKEIELP